MPAKPVKSKIRPKTKKVVTPEVKDVEKEEEKLVVNEVQVESQPKIASFSQLDTKLPSIKDDSEVLTPPVEEEPKHSNIGPVDIPPHNPESQEEVVVSQETAEEGGGSDDIKDWLKDIRPDTTKEIEKKNGFSFKLFFLFIIIFALIGALIGGMFYYASSMKTDQEENTTDTKTTSESPTVTPTATPEVKPDLSKLKVNVLNGSGVSGEAAKVKTLLTSKGFTAENVKTGNASTSGNKTTTISLKGSVPESVFKELETILSTDYTVAKDEKPLADTSANDIEIIVGVKK